MSARLLEANGTVNAEPNELSNSAIELVVGVDTIEQLDSLHEVAQIVLNFTSSADGRGFSMAAALRERLGYTGKLYAGGQLIPDQLSLAFQCGFDAVIVDSEQWRRYGSESWMKGLNPDVSRSYLRSHRDDFESIWEHRAGLA